MARVEEEKRERRKEGEEAKGGGGEGVEGLNGEGELVEEKKRREKMGKR